jgi:hypothetical protein
MEELTPEEKARLAAWSQAVQGRVRACLTRPASAGDPAAVPAHGLDPDRVRDAVHIPDDGGPLRDSLIDILSRIPDGWGRWIGVHKGWYPFIAKLNYDLHQLDSGYVVLQVKQKMGRLAFYAETGDEDVREAFDELIREAESRSGTICEECGAPGRKYMRWDYRATLCAACAAAAPVMGGWRFVAVD